MEQNTSIRPLGTDLRQAAISRTAINESLSVQLDTARGGGLLILNKHGEVIGHLTGRHGLAKELASGRHVLFARLTGIRGDGITVRITTGDPGDTLSPYHDEWVRRIAEGHPRRHASGGSGYRVNLVGESFRQDAIARSNAGEPVRFLHDVNNQYDPRAIMVVNARNEQIGFLPRDGWLTRALLDEERGYTARIAEIHPRSSERPHAAVVLQVRLG